MFTLTMKRVAALIAAALLLFAFTACEEAGESGQEKEDKARQSTYNGLVEKQPAHTMDYSPTRDSKNFWIDTWDAKGKISYVYLLSNGKPWSYAVLKRLPVTYCTSLVVPYQLKDTAGDGFGPNIVVPGPSVDGTYSSGSNCSTFYGEDATTGAYVEWTAGQDSTMLVRDQPLPVNSVEGAIPLGDTTAEEAQDLD